MQINFLPVATLFIALVSTAPLVSAEISFDGHTIASGVNAWYAVASDLDGDGDVDVVGSGRLDNRVLWWENNGRESFTAHIVKQGWDHANSISAADIDSDGDVDVVATASQAAMGWGEIAWFENNGNQRFTEHTLSTGWGRPSSAIAVDLDGDGDLDVVTAGQSNEQVAWWESHRRTPPPRRVTGRRSPARPASDQR